MSSKNNNQLITIMGPYKLNIITIKGKNLFLFGETHDALGSHVWTLDKQQRENLAENKVKNTVYFHVFLQKMYEYLKNKNECLDLFVENKNESFFFKDKGAETKNQDDGLTHLKTHSQFLTNKKNEVKVNHRYGLEYRRGQYLNYLNYNIFPLYYSSPNVRIHNIEIRGRNFINSDLKEIKINTIFRFLWNEFFNPMEFNNHSFIPSKGLLIEVLFGNDEHIISLIANPDGRQEFLDMCSWSMDDLKTFYDVDVMEEEGLLVNDCNEDTPYIKNASLFKAGELFDSERLGILNDILYDTLGERDNINATREEFVDAFSQVPFKTHEDIFGWCNYFFMMGGDDNVNYDNVIKLFIKQLNNKPSFKKFFGYSRTSKMMDFNNFTTTRMTLHEQVVNYDGDIGETFEKVANTYVEQILIWASTPSLEIPQPPNYTGETTITQLKRLSLFWSHITDIYMFFRIFRRWSDNKETRSVEGCKGDNYIMKNIISYTGSNHNYVLIKLINSAFNLPKQKVYNIELGDETKNQYSIEIDKSSLLIYPLFKKVLGLSGGRRRTKKRKKRKNEKNRQKVKTRKKQGKNKEKARKKHGKNTEKTNI